MALTVETGSIVLGADSYVSLSDANAYFAKRNDPASWTAADDAAKENALRIATKIVDGRYAFVGTLVDTNNQALDWPRYNAYDSQDRFYDSNEIPQPVKDAVCEFALVSLRDGDLTEPTENNAERLKLDVLEIETFGSSRGGSTTPKYRYIDGMLTRLTTNGSSGSISTLERHM